MKVSFNSRMNSLVQTTSLLVAGDVPRGVAVQRAAEESVAKAEEIANSWMTTRNVPGWSPETRSVTTEDPTEKRRVLNRKSAKVSRLKRRCYMLALENSILAKEESCRQLVERIEAASKENESLSRQLESPMQSCDRHQQERELQNAIGNIGGHITDDTGVWSGSDHNISSFSITEVEDSDRNHDLLGFSRMIRIPEKPFDLSLHELVVSSTSSSDTTDAIKLTQESKLQCHQSPVNFDDLFPSQSIYEQQSFEDIEIPSSIDPIPERNILPPQIDARDSRTSSQESEVQGIGEDWAGILGLDSDLADATSREYKLPVNSIFTRELESPGIELARSRTKSIVRGYVRERWGRAVDDSRTNGEELNPVPSPPGVRAKLRDKIERRAVINRKSSVVGRVRLHAYLAELERELNHLEGHEESANTRMRSLNEKNQKLRLKLAVEERFQNQQYALLHEIAIGDFGEHIFSLARLA
mmetsp:Transcript_13008/g.26384  ORF Transcript_13008/g.26384 Transcript_13008/m.26384 type:complete len:471 (-) Transcript_13008:188-1600(-)|eukprot:CAMPEP_0184685988 /NCGR_PEP_ID=MMETSP0312-20130426/20952_1 /TAXON_ID=31354 /ORGANISM="Compsopogon coeruleus, Strain SAG 36.94" /LENGTH=470 /DNA_ID=CAMNT_0027140639 /DNA_START=269 /DNA_END=1681 /DNA_ORIENTATION=-